MSVASEGATLTGRERLRHALWAPIRGARRSASPRHYFPHRALLVGGIAALVVAAVLVGYFDRRAAALQRQQTLVIMQQVCERTATVVAGRVRNHLDAAVLETLEGIGHPQLIDYDLPRVASYYSEGLRRHPYIDRFFLWSADRSADFGDQVLFFSPSAGRAATRVITGANGDALGALDAIPELGREILRLARDTAGQRTFVVLERTVAGVPYQLVIHLLWNDERREEFFGIIGYTVNLANVGSALIGRVLDAEIRGVLNPHPRSPRLVFTLVDDRGRVVHGPPLAAALPSAEAPLDLLFFPGEPLKPWLAERPPAREWRIVISAAEPPEQARLFGGWMVGSVVLLICIAVFCAVTVDRQAIRLSHMQSDFVANVSHQLKTPVSLLSATIQTLRLERVPSNKQPEYLEMALAQTARLTALVERILHFSRSEGAGYGFRLERIDLVPLVEAAVERFRAEAHGRRVPIRFEAGAAALPVEGDPQAIEQVILNLLENALKYGDDHNDVFVRVETAGGRARISVHDRGTGIHAEDLAHVFEKFYRGRNGDRGRQGFGLGLALVASIVRAHRGHVRVDSEAGRGSTFYIELPAAPEIADGV
ncbi:MAG: sensor histidine kinase [Vicinamibacterales bacterium]